MLELAKISKDCWMFMRCALFACTSFIFTISAVAETLPTNECFLLGDYLDRSIDARAPNCKSSPASVSFKYGTVSIEGICSTASSSSVGDINIPSSTAGQYCWCRITDLKYSKDYNETNYSEYAVFLEDGKSNKACEEACNCDCTKALAGDTDKIRTSLYTKSNSEFCPVRSVETCTTILHLDDVFCSASVTAYGDTAPDWKISFDGGRNLMGTSLCSVTGGTPGAAGTPDETTSGGHCWCRATEYNDGATTYTATSSAWMYTGDYHPDPNDCLSSCSRTCNKFLVGRNYLCTMGEVDFCMNTYTVHFEAGDSNNDGSGTAATGSMSDISTYEGGTVTLPANGFTAPAGYGFKGWSCDNNIGNQVADATFTMPAANVTCTAQWFAAPFSLTTTSLSSGNTTFQFYISAAGTFYVDCGDDGILSGTGASGNTITKNNTSGYRYTCTYSSTGAKTIKFGGGATGYSTGATTSAIRFNINVSSSDTNAQKIASISGSLGQIFGTVANPATGTGQPKFYYTFCAASNMAGTNISDPNNSGMNYALPPTLFSGISGQPAESMFNGTFLNCTGLTGSIPSTLFGNLSGIPAEKMFIYTFQGCTGLDGPIPSGLFGSLTGSPAGHMFRATFKGCTGLTGPIPSGLFGNLTGTPAEYMFNATFDGCTHITGSIPSGLFGNLSGTPALGMFGYTFRNCGLSTFGNTTYVPGDFLENITTNTSVSNQATNMFSNTLLNNPCPANTYAVTRTQFSNAGKPWCSECPSGTTSPAGSTSASQCVRDYKFSLTTTSLSSGDATFQFKMSAAGTFYVDCGTDGVLSGIGVSGDTITRADTNEATYTCTYSSTGAKTVRFAGTATGYTVGNFAAIKFSISSSPNDTNVKKIASISGSLGQIFGTIQNPATGSGQPVFSMTFYGASNMTGTNISDPNNTVMNYALPPTLFDGISGSPVQGMFTLTFAGCSGLTGSIPAGLFGNLTGSPIGSMFLSTFYGCSGLTGSIPSGLFGSLSGSPAHSMFAETFYGCSGLTGSIPAGLFGNLTGSPAVQMFMSTFQNCSGLTGTNINDPNNPGMKYAIPAGLFGNLTGSPEQNMFRSTFSGCSGLTGSIPTGLFGSISGSPADYMFYNTFYNCSGLTGSIPSGLFGNLTGSPANSMFQATFQGCSSLTGSIPSGLFGNLSGSPAVNMFNGTFQGCRGLTGTNTNDPNNPGMKYAIPSGLFGNLTGSPAGSMFSSTFQGCSSLTGTIPSGLFGNLSGSPAQYMFSSTFQDCSGLTGSIPSGLFGNLSGSPANGMFLQTFSGCRNLSGSIPSGLFGNLSGSPAQSMFNTTFQHCSGLTGSIPSGLFGNLSGAPATRMFYYTFNGSGNITGFGDKTYVPGDFLENITTNTSVSNQATGMFSNTQLANPCPANTYASTRTQFNDAGKPWCSECPSGTISPAGSTDVSQCVRDYKFSLTTTSLSSGDATFQFYISAAGTFYVDCGTDGVLSGTGVSGDTITKNNTNGYTYTCTYSSTGAKTVRFAGTATGYSSGIYGSAIKFNISGTNATSETNVRKISSISGSLGQIFGTVANPSTGIGQPKFFQAFLSATNMTGTTTSISDPNNSGMNYALPPTLFDGISGTPVQYMFDGTFFNCSGLTGSIPSGLFGNLSGAPATSMFNATFSGCSGLTGSIPSGLFGNLSGSPAESMFSTTFYGCSSLTGSIPSGLFGNLSGSPAEGMFSSTFSGCSGLTGTNTNDPNNPGMKYAIPSGLFGNLTGSPASNMFAYTFSSCSSLTGSIPSGLFGNLTGTPAAYMFNRTFQSCRGLTGSIPSGLFGSISGTPATYMFDGTFFNCSGLTGSIPSGLFGSLSGAPANNMFNGTFQGCSGLTGTNINDPNNPGMKYAIPSGLFGNLTGSPANNMFSFTFSGCRGLTGSIPSGLFGNLTGSPATSMFNATFASCSGLTGSIPAGLFGNLTGSPAQSMFNDTFQACSNLTGFGNKTYVPGDFLENITTNTSVSNQATNMFYNTQLNNPCPANTYAVTRAQFSNAGKPWCTECPSGTISPAGSTSDSQCVVPLTVTYACGTGASGTAPTDTNEYLPNATVNTIESFGTCGKSGYFASGWVCDGTSVVNGGTFTITADTTCTTQWSGNSIDLTWDGGGTPAMCTYGGTFNVPTPTTRTGYVFTGWSQTVPTGYTELKYIESTGTQYIDTGIKGTLNTKAVLDFQIHNYNNSGYILGGRTSQNTRAFLIGSNSGHFVNTTFPFAQFDTVAAHNVRQAPNFDLNRHIYELSSDGFYIDGTLYTTYSNPVSFTTAENITLFGRYNAGTFAYGAFKSYSLKIYENNNLIRNFIPAKRNSDNVVGMWDTVTRTFFTNAGSGTFTAGPAVQ